MPFPTDEESLENGEAVLPEDMPTPDIPTAGELVRVGDVVQATKITPSSDLAIPDAVVTSQFTVTQVWVHAVAGSPLGNLSQEDGWVFEVITRAPLVFPEVRATISATLVDGTELTLQGKGRVWMTEDFDMVPVEQIRDFTLVSGG